MRDSDLGWKTMPHNLVPAGAIIDAPGNTTDFKGSVLRHAVAAGTVLVATDTLSPSSPGFLAAALQPGMRAVSVGIDDVSGNAGLIQSGDYVDLLLTQQIDTKSGPGGSSAGHSYASETVVSHVRVLAVGSEYQRPKVDSEANTRARTVTLEVLPETAQVISVAARLGSLTLVLRSFAVDRNPNGSSAPVADLPLPPVYASEVSRALTPPPAPTDAVNIMIYRGSDAPVASTSAPIDHSAANTAKAEAQARDAANAQVVAAANASAQAANSVAAAANKLANKIPAPGSPVRPGVQ